MSFCVSLRYRTTLLQTVFSVHLLRLGKQFRHAASCKIPIIKAAVYQGSKSLMRHSGQWKKTHLLRSWQWDDDIISMEANKTLLIPAAHSPNDTLGTGSDGVELLVPSEHRKGGVTHLHAVELPLPLGHGSSHWVPLDESNLREKEQRKWEWWRDDVRCSSDDCILSSLSRVYCTVWGGWHCRWLIQGESDIMHSHTERHRIPTGCH